MRTGCANRLKLPNGLPCANTFSRVFQAIEPSAFAACIASHLTPPGFGTVAGQIAIDGKALRGSRSGEQSHVHAVSAWACDAGITLAQAFVGDKSNEPERSGDRPPRRMPFRGQITAIPELLAILNLKGCVVTIDAMGTQRAIAADIVVRGGDYILCAKGNQGRPYDEVREQFDFAVRQLAGSKLDAGRWSVARTLGSGHDRTETRSVIVCRNLGWMDAAIRAEWKDIGSVVMVHRHTLLGAGRTRSETSYYISSLKGTRAPEMLRYIRGHWKIENSCHWGLDAICREDHSQVRDRSAASNFGTLRRMALNAHNQAVAGEKKRKSLPKRELRAAHDEAYLEKLLSLV